MRKPIGAFVLAIVLLLAGCSGALDTTGADESDPTPVCKTPERGNGSLDRCSIAERPPDIQITNRANESHTLAVRVVHENGTEVFVTEEELSANMDWAHYYEDVIRAPGNYTFIATGDNSTVERYTRRFDERWYGSGNLELEIVVEEGGGVLFFEIPHQ